MRTISNQAYCGALGGLIVVGAIAIRQSFTLGAICFGVATALSLVKLYLAVIVAKKK